MRRNRNTLVTLERATTVRDDYNEETESWAQVGEEWAQVFYGRGDERRQAAAELASQTATFQMDANETTLALAENDRLQADGRIWDIRGIAPHTPRHGDVEITARRLA